jgi:hypothetical protein
MRCCCVLSLIVLWTLPAWAAEEHWVATWTNAQPMIPRAPPAPPPPAPVAVSGPDALVQAIASNGFHDQTVRMIVRTSIAGSRLRLRLTSPFGAQQVLIGDVHVAPRQTGSAIVPGSDHPVLFNGQPHIAIGPGMVLVSDPVALSIPAQADLAVSLYLPQDTGASALARFDHDVLAQAGARWVVVLLGINDIGRANIDPVTADELIGGYRQIIERSHTHGLKVLGGTLPPYQGAGYNAMAQAFDLAVFAH